MKYPSSKIDIKKFSMKIDLLNELYLSLRNMIVKKTLFTCQK